MSIRGISQASELDAFYDLLVIGAGPAGMTAATEAARAGAHVAVLDENPRAGGQIYREITRNKRETRSFLGQDYWQGKSIANRFEGVRADYAPRATVWSVERRSVPTEHSVVGVTVAGQARMIEASAVLLATGAQERPMPVPGWTLPGVMTAGAAQIALKSAGAIPRGPVVLAGSGPLLYLLASQLIDAGVADITVLDTAPSFFRLSVLRRLPSFLISPYAVKGIALFLKVKRIARVFPSVRSISIGGKDCAETVTFGMTRATKTITAKTVLLHQGVIPSTNLTGAAGCKLEWDNDRRAFEPVTDEVGRTSQPGIYVAGDGAGISGAQAAEVSGRIAAIGILMDLRKGDPDPLLELSRLKRLKKRYLRGRAFLDALYSVRPEFLAPTDPDTIVCRCEEISAGALRAAIALGPPGPNQLKTFLRCGMGQCQGRLCAATVTEIMASEREVSPREIGTYRFRSPVKPLRLAELAQLPHTPRALSAVTGRDPVDHDIN